MRDKMEIDKINVLTGGGLKTTKSDFWDSRFSIIIYLLKLKLFGTTSRLMSHDCANLLNSVVLTTSGRNIFIVLLLLGGITSTLHTSYDLSICTKSYISCFGCLSVCVSSGNNLQLLLTPANISAYLIIL